MEDFDYESDMNRTIESEIQREIREAFKQRSVYQKGVERIDRALKDLCSLKNQVTGHSVTLLDDELIYCLKYALDHLAPVTRAFSATALRFGKDGTWCEKVIRYQPRKCQIERVIMALETEKYPSLKLIKKHNQLNEKNLFKFNEWRGLINHLKDALKLAQLLECKELEITRLESLLAKQEVVNHDLQAVRKSSLLSSQAESIHALRKEFPEVTATEIAQAKGISRQTVYRHLKSGLDSFEDDLVMAS